MTEKESMYYQTTESEKLMGRQKTNKQKENEQADRKRTSRQKYTLIQIKEKRQNEVCMDG